ncbi:phage tail tape measure protein [Rhodococcus sp. HM1]|uniref:phage tail tape measure protein n=1 Tax=Rhodococcus sp. HM1 TaxID=2937759 RepID=UPI00200A6ED9|nr:phage tail tape measure protein [Rhodococcus sp. HM1]MCK8675133.1 phage tail tape measure protein [Rhodococcus sp. HM1]
MALDVGELVARLTLDDSRFVQGTERAQQQSQRATQQISNGFQRISQAAQRAGQAAQAVEINRRLEQQARDAAQRIQELERNAQRADQSVDDIVMNTQLLNDARRAAQEIEEIQAAARQAAGAVDTIELGNRLQQDLQAAQQELEDLYQQASQGGGPAGSRSGGNFLSGFADAVGNLGSKTGPIGASLLGVAAIGLTAGAALAAAIKDGMSAELNRDLFQAQTGVTEAQARKFAQAAGEAYADTFGESLEANLGTAKAALGSGLLDPGATQRDAEQMIRSLDGVSRIIGEEIPRVSRSAAQAVKTGFAADVNDAFDLIVKGSQMGLNVSEDWLDTIDEYGTQFRQLGLTGAEAMGLMGQAVKAGARDTDTAADALKEFAIRAQDGSKASAEGYELLGLSAEEMTAKIAEGGESARDGLELVLTKLREIEDPVERNAAAVALFGTKAEDLGQAMYAMDLTTAVQSMNDYEGAARRAIDVMNGNSATSVEGATRAVSMAADGLKAALAEAFGPHIQKFADTISNNRAGVIQFFIDIGNKAFDGAEAILQFVANGMRGFGEFAKSGSDMAASMLDTFSVIVAGLDGLLGPLGDLIPGMPDFGDVAKDLQSFADKARDGGVAIQNGMNAGADGIENRLIPAVGAAQDRFNDFAGDLKLSAAFNDEIQKVNDAISEVGIAIDGSTVKIENFNGTLDKSIPTQARLDQQLAGLKEQFEAQTRTGLEAGATIEELTGQYAANRGELIQQAMQMGLTNRQALDLINSYGLVPNLVQTQIRQPGMPEAHSALDVLQGKIEETPDEKVILTEALTQDAIDELKHLGITVKELPDGTVEVVAETDEADLTMRQWLAQQRFADVQVRVHYQNLQAQNDAIVSSAAAAAQRQAETGQYQRVHYADGGVRTRANGMLDTAHIANGQGNGILARTPFGPVRYAEGETGWEAYIPGALSKRPRSERILQEVAKRFGFGLIRTVRSEAGKIFKGDPKSLDAQSDPTGWRALLGGDYSGRTASLLGIQEDHPLVDVILSARKAIAEGDYDGALANYGIHEDSPITDLLLRLNERLFPKMADGGIVGPSGFDAEAAIERAKSKAGRPYGYATLDDCSGHLSDVFNAGTGQSVRFTTDSDFESMGWVPGFDPDGFSIGTNGGVGPDGHMTGYLYGTNIESDGSNGIQYGGTADSPLDFPYVYHWPGATMGDDPSAERLGITGGDSSTSGRTVGVTDSGAVMSTDGQRVFVTNWPDTLGGNSKAEEKSADERKPILTAGLKVFENGGIADRGAQIQQGRGNGILWAESETEWEGYIPGAASKRPRSIAITREIARRFGYQLVPMADGGLTGFGGYGGRSPASFDVPLTPDGWAGMSANKRRATMYNLAALGIGGAFALASGFDADGRFTGQFDTGANSHPALEKGFQMLVEKLEEIRAAAANPDPVDVQVDVDRGAGTANLSIMKAGM